MQSFTARAALFATLVSAATAIDGIVAPGNVSADQPFEVTFQNANDDKFRVYLAAALTGSNGPTCYLVNSTSLTESLNVTVPAGVGPSADYYSIAIADLTTGEGATYSNRFNLTGATGNYSEYENGLEGAPFWSAEDLPCSAYPCARDCADASYPEDLHEDSAFQTMRKCILQCKGVTPSANVTTPAQDSSSHSSTLTGEMAVITMGSSTITAMEEVITTGGKTYTEAIVGDQTITLGGAAKTISSEKVSLATNGVELGGSTTVAFSSMTATVAATSTTDNAAAAATTSKAAAGKQIVAGAAAVGFAGLAFFI